MLTATQFQTWCRTLQLPPHACQWLTTIRASRPVRRVGSRAGNVSGAYASRKMGCTIQFESHKVELWAIYSMEHDPRVLEYYDQPLQLDLTYAAKSGRMTRVKHTPDFLVFMADGVWLEEWKPEDKLLALASAQPHRYQRDAQGRWRCPPGEDAATRLGLRYRVRSSAQVSPQAIRNLIFLDEYCAAPEVDPETAQGIMDRVRSAPGLSVAALRAQVPQVSLDAVFTLITRAQLYVDLAAAPLIEHDAVHLYATRATAEAHALLLASQVPSAASAAARPSQPLALTANMRLLWDGRLFTLLNFGQTTTTLQPETGALVEIPRTDFVRLMDTGTITVPRAPSASSFVALHADVQHAWSAASERDLEIATRRYQALQSPATASGVPARTLRSWAERFREAEATYGVGFVGLLPRTARSGNRMKASQEALGLLDTYIAEHFEQPTQPHARAVYRLYCQQCAHRGLSTLSERTFYRRVAARRGLAQTHARRGKRAAYREQPWYWELTRTTPRHGDRPWEIVHLDHTELDIELCTATNRLLGRPWATLAVDAYSRCILACYLSFDPPSYRSCMMVLRVCVRRHQRLPQILVVDGGPEFRSVYFESLVARYGGTKKTRPGAQPRFGSVVERLFGTTNTAFIHTLLGNTQATQQVRTVTPAVDPQRHAVWQLGDLYEYLCEWAYQIYEQTPHATLGVTPREAYVTGLELGGERGHRRIAYDEEFLMTTLPSPRHKTAKVMPGQGVKVHYLYYWHDALRHPEVERTRVPIRYDPFNIGVVYAYVHGQWVPCRSQYYAAFVGHSEKELALATAVLRQQARMSHRAASITPVRLAEFLAQVHEHERVLVQRLRDQEAHAVFEGIAAGIEGRTAREPTARPAPAPAVAHTSLVIPALYDPVDLSTLPTFEEYR
jgi:putative transposase